MRIVLLPALVAVLFALAVPAKALEACQSFDGGQGCMSLDVPGGLISATDQKTWDNGGSVSIDITKGDIVKHYVASANIRDAKGKVGGRKQTSFSGSGEITITEDITLEYGYTVTTQQPSSHDCSFAGKSGGCIVCGDNGTVCKHVHWNIRPIAREASRAAIGSARR